MVPVFYVLLFCPRCKEQHVDQDIWAKRLHKTHLCAHCDHLWQASNDYTFGIRKVAENVP